MFAYRRLAGVELLGGFGEASVLVDGNKYFQMSSFYLLSPVINLFHVPVKNGIRISYENYSQLC